MLVVTVNILQHLSGRGIDLKAFYSQKKQFSITISQSFVEINRFNFFFKIIRWCTIPKWSRGAIPSLCVLTQSPIVDCKAQFLHGLLHTQFCKSGAELDFKTKWWICNVLTTRQSVQRLAMSVVNVLLEAEKRIIYAESIALYSANEDGWDTLDTRLT